MGKWEKAVEELTDFAEKLQKKYGLTDDEIADALHAARNCYIS